MIRHVMLVFVYTILITHCLSYVGAAEVEPDEITRINGVIENAATSAEADQLIEQGKLAIKDSKCPNLDEELLFVSKAANASSIGVERKGMLKRAETNVNEIFVVLREKYRHDKFALYRILVEQQHLSQILFGNDEQQQQVLQELQPLSKEVNVELAVCNLQMKLDYGKNMVHCGKKDDATVKQSLKEILDFPIFESTYAPQLDRLKSIYIGAAFLLVKITPDRELPSLVIEPFARQEIRKAMPEKYLLLNQNLPVVIRMRGKVVRWLELTSDNLLDDDPLKANLEAILKAVNNGTL